MPIYKIDSNKIVQLPETTFASEKIREETDLQQYIVNSIDIIDPNLFVISTEYSNWIDSRREIDILAIDKDANLVVIELKRTVDGGHMELQAIRYAAMVSNLTFKDAVEAYQRYTTKKSIEVNNHEQAILDFLNWESSLEQPFASDVKIILVSANFSIEITTSVLWLNQRDLDIRCISLVPQKDGNHIYLEIKQVIPLLEAQDFQVKQKAKAAEEKKVRLETRTNHDRTKYNIKVCGLERLNLNKRKAFYFVIKEAITAGIDPEEIIKITHERPWIVVEGKFDMQEVLEAEIRKNRTSFDPKRWFLQKDEIFYRNGKTYIFSNQHGGEFVKNTILNIFYNFPELKGEIIESNDVGVLNSNEIEE